MYTGSKENITHLPIVVSGPRTIDDLEIGNSIPDLKHVNQPFWWDIVYKKWYFRDK